MDEKKKREDEMVGMEEYTWGGGPDGHNRRVLHITIGAPYTLDQVECLDNFENNMRLNGSVQFMKPNTITSFEHTKSRRKMI